MDGTEPTLTAVHQFQGNRSQPALGSMVFWFAIFNILRNFDCVDGTSQPWGTYNSRVFVVREGFDLFCACVNNNCL